MLLGLPLGLSTLLVTAIHAFELLNLAFPAHLLALVLLALALCRSLHERKQQQSQCVRAAILSDRVLSSYTVHHKLHGFRLDDKQAPPKGLTRLQILQGNKVLRNLTLTLCKDVSHELNARLGPEGFGGRGAASPRWTTEPLEGPKWFRPWMTPLREKALALLDG